MPRYCAHLVGRTGRRSTLVLDAVDMASFAEHIEAEKRAYVIEIHRVETRGRRLARVRVPGALLLASLDSLELMLSSGVRVNSAVRTLAQCAPSGASRVLWTEVARHLEETGGFGGALRLFPRVFSDSMVGVVTAHEAAGRLPEGVRAIRNYSAQMLQIRREVVRGLMYPCLVCLTALGASALACTFTLPRFSKMLRDIGAERTNGLTAAMFAASDFVTAHPVLSLAAAAAPFAAVAALSGPRLRPLRDRALLGIPVVRGAVEALAMARVCATFRALAGSGIRIVEALDACAAVAGNAVYRTALIGVAAAVRENAPVGDAFDRAGLFAPEVVLAVRSAEGSLTEVFGRLSEHYMSESRHRVAVALSLIEPAVLLVVLAWVLGVALAVVLPVVEVVNRIH